MLTELWRASEKLRSSATGQLRQYGLGYEPTPLTTAASAAGRAGASAGAVMAAERSRTRLLLADDDDSGGHGIAPVASSTRRLHMASAVTSGNVYTITKPRGLAAAAYDDEDGDDDAGTG
jgi:hypothetical protein